MSDELKALAMELARTDLEGLYKKHSDMWDMLDRGLRFLLTVESLPLVGAGLMISGGIFNLEHLQDATQVPALLVFLTLAVGFIGIVLLQVIIHYRLDVLLYARAINSFRAFYVEELGDKYGPRRLEPAMPTDPSIPSNFEPLRATGLVVLCFASINAAYVAFAMTSLFEQLTGGCGVVVGVSIVAFQYVLYWLATRREPILGARESG